MLSETWTERDDTFEMENFSYFNFSRPHRHANARKTSGGLGVFIRNVFKNAVEIYHCYRDVLVWVRFKKDMFNTTHDLYIGSVYIPPEDSTRLEEDPFIILQSEISSLPNNCHFLICGDFNSRTGTVPDLELNNIFGSEGDLDDLLPDEITATGVMRNFLHANGILQRCSRDYSRCNNYGTQLLQLCKTTGLFIVNGRVGADKRDWCMHACRHDRQKCG